MTSILPFLFLVSTIAFGALDVEPWKLICPDER
jgi:hypothetical protein